MGKRKRHQNIHGRGGSTDHTVQPRKLNARLRKPGATALKAPARERDLFWLYLLGFTVLCVGLAFVFK